MRRLRWALIACALSAAMACKRERAPADCRPDMVNLNTASASELALLKGIGPERAAAIIAYREAHEAFAKVAHVKRVAGIGEKTYERLRQRLTVTCQTSR